MGFNIKRLLQPRRALRSAACLGITALLLYGGVGSQPALGRFQVADASGVDREASLSSEYYNDLVSYRFSPLWDELWQGRPLAYRVSAGSLNANRFYLVEDLKLKSHRLGQPGFSFKQARLETFNEQSFEQELALLSPVWAGVSAALLAEGGTFKKWGDLGFSVAYGDEDRAHHEWFGRLSYWAVDHFYNTKVDEAGDHYQRKPHSWQGQWGIPLAANIQLQGTWIYDAPLVWQRPSAGYEYRYERQRFNLELAAKDFWPAWTARFKFASEHKNEAQLPYLAAKLEAAQQNGDEALQRQSVETEISLARLVGRFYQQAGVIYLRRASTYEGKAPLVPPGSSGELAREGIPSQAVIAASDVRRRELVLYGLWSLPRQAYLWQWGLTYNRMHLEEAASRKQRGELKMQTAIDCELGEAVRLAVNFTWDLDELYRLRLQPFRPWGGGNVQILAVF